MRGGIRVRLLGPVDVVVDGARRAMPGPGGRAVVAVLALQPGTIVSADALVDAIWADNPPSRARNALQSHVSRLRRVLGKDRILARPPGYVLEVDQHDVDVGLAEHLVRRAGRSSDQTERGQLLRAAVGLWRGQAFANLDGLAWFDEQAARLDRLWLHAKVALFDVGLALGEHAEVALELERLSRSHPFDEQIHAQLMLALYRCGRQADALAVYHRLRGRLSDELGIDPSRQLRDLESAILRQDRALDPPLHRVGPMAVPALTSAVRERLHRAGRPSYQAAHQPPFMN